MAKAFEDVRTSEIQIQTKENEVRQREAEARAIEALGLTGQEYDILKAIESGKITFWVLRRRERRHDHRARTPAPGPSQAPSSPAPSPTTTTTAPSGGGGGWRGTHDDRPDIVLFLTDQQRFDQLGYASGGHFQTPNLDRVARQRRDLRERLQRIDRLRALTGRSHDRASSPTASRPRRTARRCGRGSGRSPTSCGGPATRRR